MQAHQWVRIVYGYTATRITAASIIKPWCKQKMLNHEWSFMDVNLLFLVLLTLILCFIFININLLCILALHSSVLEAFALSHLRIYISLPTRIHDQQQHFFILIVHKEWLIKYRQASSYNPNILIKQLADSGIRKACFLFKNCQNNTVTAIVLSPETRLQC